MVNANSSPNNNPVSSSSSWDSLTKAKFNNPTPKKGGLLGEGVFPILNNSENEQPKKKDVVSEFEERVQRRLREMENESRNFHARERNAAMSHEDRVVREYQKKSSELEQMTERKKSLTNHSETRGLADTANYTVEEYTTYKNPRGAELAKEVEDLRKRAEDAPRLDRLEKESKQEKEQKKYKNSLDQIVDTAMEINEEKIEEYRKKSFVEKWKIRLKGEQPKKISKKEALIKYGEEAVDRMMGPVEEKLEEEYNALVEVNKDIFSDPVEVEARRRRGLSSSLEDEIKSLKFSKEYRAKKQKELYMQNLGFLNDRFATDSDASKNYGSN